jgi:hypothetical protein
MLDLKMNTVVKFTDGRYGIVLPHDGSSCGRGIWTNNGYCGHLSNFETNGQYAQLESIKVQKYLPQSHLGTDLFFVLEKFFGKNSNFELDSWFERHSYAWIIPKRTVTMKELEELVGEPFEIVD